VARTPGLNCFLRCFRLVSVPPPAIYNNP
jgi:hypothetical protein